MTYTATLLAAPTRAHNCAMKRCSRSWQSAESAQGMFACRIDLDMQPRVRATGLGKVTVCICETQTAVQHLHACLYTKATHDAAWQNPVMSAGSNLGRVCRTL